MSAWHNLFALYPLLTGPVFVLSHRGRWRAAAMMALLLALAALPLGQRTGLPVAAGLDALLFLGAALFPLALRWEVQQASRGSLTRKLFLQSEISKAQIQCEKLADKRARLFEEMDQISKRYAFAKSLVSYLEEKPILQDLGSILASEKIVLGLAFSTADIREADPTLFDDPGSRTPQQVTWAPAFVSGWVNDEEWSAILKHIQFPVDASTHFIVVDLLSQAKLTTLAEFRRLLLLGGGGWKEKVQALFLVGVPVRWEGQVRGLLTFVLENALPKYFLDEVSVYAQLLGLGLHKTALYRLVLEHSRRDGLTNLYLRHILLERLNNETNFTKRYGTSFSLLMLDLDHFKAVNDTFGHQAGDAVLKAVADCMKATLHPGVTICRYGGEEFAVVVGLAPQNEVLITAEKLCAAVAALEVPVSDGSTARVTVSIGVAHYLPDAPAPDELIHRADVALYWAKKEGRNRVRVWKEKKDA